MKRGTRDSRTRQCPIPHEHCAAPGCRWCGKPVESKRGGRWHAECVQIYHQAQHPSRMRERLAERDGLRCWLCRKAPERWKAETWIDRSTIERVTALQVDHVIPLWSVRDLPDRIRWLYFMIEACILLCPTCHKAKSAREMARMDHPTRWISRARKRPAADK